MPAFRFLHAADLHVDSPLASLGERASAASAQVLRASREALEEMVRLAIREKVGFSVIAGDLLDGAVNDHASVQHLMGQLGILARHAPVFLVRGNHDAINVIGRQLRWPEGVFEFPHERPGTCGVPGLPVSVHGQSFPERSCERDLAADYPEPVQGHFNLGMLHTSLDGSEGHGRYAPTSVGNLSAKGYDYWALGHVHARAIVRDRQPAIVYPGNIQGRSIRETGPRGCALVRVGENLVPEVEFRNLDAARFHRLEVSLEGMDSPDGWEKRLRDALDTAGLSTINIVRVVFSGTTPFPPRPGEEMENSVAEVMAGHDGSLHLEGVRVECRLPSGGGTDLNLARGHFLRVLDRWAADPEGFGRMLSEDREFREVLERCGNAADSRFRADFLRDTGDLQAVLGELENPGAPVSGGNRR